MWSYPYGSNWTFSKERLLEMEPDKSSSFQSWGFCQEIKIHPGKVFPVPLAKSLS